VVTNHPERDRTYKKAILLRTSQGMASFNKLFPGSTVREWKFTSDSLYKVHFTRKGIAYDFFKANGTLVKVQRAK